VPSRGRGPYVPQPDGTDQLSVGRKRTAGTRWTMTTSRPNRGSVRQLPSGRHQIRYRIGTERRTGDTTYTTKRAAHAALAALRTDLERGTWLDPNAAKDITLRECAPSTTRSSRARTRSQTPERLTPIDRRRSEIALVGIDVLNAIRPRMAGTYVHRGGLLRPYDAVGDVMTICASTSPRPSLFSELRPARGVAVVRSQ